MIIERSTALLLASTICLLGCGAEYDASSEYSSVGSQTLPEFDHPDAADLAGFANEPNDPEAQSSNGLSSVSIEKQNELGHSSSVSDRKIIYTANLSFTVDSMDPVTASIERLCAQFDGFIANASVSGASHDQRQASWTLRIPSQNYRAFLSRAGDLGEMNSFREETQEVTAEYFDVEARIRNKKNEEDRLNQILAERPGKLDDVLRVEKELSRVREEIERMQGRLRVLSNLTAYSTVQISVIEIHPFAPPATPTFGTLVQRTWQDTTSELFRALQAIVLWVISVGPWLVVFGLPLLLSAWAIRRKSSRTANA